MAKLRIFTLPSLWDSKRKRNLFVKKRIISLCIMAALLLTMVPYSAFPVSAAQIVDSGWCGDNVQWKLESDGTLTIFGSGPMDDYLGPGHDTAFIAPWDDKQSSITAVQIENSVTSIGVGAFSLCDSLTSVTIPNSVTSIGDDAFKWCNSLTSITILDGVKFIGDGAFFNCDSLTNVTIPDGVTSIGDDAFFSCDSLTSVTIPDGVTSIGDRAFSFCDSLTSVTISDSVTSIGYGAFGNCGSLTSITIPNSVTSIGDDAFMWCNSLTSITIPDGVKFIGDGAFFNCDSLTNVTIPDGVTSIGDDAFFGCGSLTSVTIPDSVAEIGWRAFAECEALEHVIIGSGVSTFGAGYHVGCRVFENCPNLNGITFLGNAPEFELDSDDAFEGTTVTCYYRAGDESWEECIVNTYGGTVTWVPCETLHEFTKVVTPPSGDEPGYTTYTCACGYSYVGSEEENTADYFDRQKDRNTFDHTNPNFIRYDKGEEKRYYISDEYFQLILDQASLYDDCLLTILRFTEEWEGACYGLSTSLAIASTGGLADVTQGRDFCDLAPPKDIEAEPNLRNVIHYYHLLQNIQDANSKTYSDSEFFKSGVTLGSFLKSFVDEAIRSEDERKPFILAYTYPERGHAVVVCGYEKIEEAGRTVHRIKIYDPNGWNANKYYYFDIAEDYSSFIYTDYKMNTYGGNLAEMYRDIRFYGIDTLTEEEVYRSSHLSALSGAVSSKACSEFARVTFPMNQMFSLTNTEGETLYYDGESYGGTMTIHDTNMFGEESVQIELVLDASEEFVLSDFSEDFEIAFELDGAFYMGSAAGCDSIVFSRDGNVQFQGTSYEFTGAVSTNLGSCEMARISGQAEGSCAISVAEDKVEVDVQGKCENVRIDTFSGVACETHVLDDTASNITIQDGEDHSTSISAKSEPSDTQKRIWGDADGSETVDYMDAMLVLRHVVKLITLDEEIQAVCNVDGQGEIDYMDAMLILRHAVKLIDKFPVEIVEDSPKAEKRLVRMDETVSSGTTYTTTFHYGENGLPSSTVETSSYDSSESSRTYIYDDDNRLLEIRTSWWGDTGPEIKYHYDENGFLVGLSGIGEGGGVGGYTRENDEQGRIIKKVSKSDWDTTVTEYTYSEDGTQMQVVSTSTDYQGEVSVRRTTYSYVYDAQGQLVSETYEGTAGNGATYSGTIEYRYDKEGRLVSKKSNRIDTDGTVYDATTEYEHDHPPFVTTAYNGALPHEYVIQDINGNPIWSLYTDVPASVEIDDDGYITKIVYIDEEYHSYDKTYVFVYEEIPQA